MCVNSRRYVCCSEYDVVSIECNEPTSCLVRPIGAHCCEVMYFGCFGFRGDLGFLNCDDVCMCVVNKQFQVLEFVSESVYVDLQYDEISLTFTPVLKSLHWLKIQDRITYKILMLTYKSYYNIAPTYLCELISRRESSVNTRLGSDQHQLIMPPISKDCSNTFLDRSFIYAAPCEWNKLSECIRTSSFDSFRKSVKTMLFTQQYG